MATYEYLCLACERPFEQRRPMGGAVDTALRCPSCGDERVRRRFSFAATAATRGDAPASTGGGCCGGACACGG